MLKKTIEFEDLDGNVMKKDFYFNLSKAEIVRKNLRGMTLNANGEPDIDGFKAQLDAIIKSRSGRVIMDAFEDIIREAYGERDDDGIAFHKSPELSARFMSTDAYDVLFLELVTNAEKAAEFVNGIMPKNLDLPAGPDRSQDLSTKVDEIVKTAMPTPPRTPLGLPKDPAQMTHEELLALVRQQAPVQGGGQ